ncbi:MAG: transcription antitermination factor NusB [Planctomycetota bacterium]
MSARHDIRRLAMQVLYQLDVTRPRKSAAARDSAHRADSGLPSADQLAEELDEEHDSASTRRFAADLALAAWAVHPAADERVATLAPDWPTHRQPPVDRAILRLAYYEITSGHAPPKVAINEAVELAKQYCAENAPAFINGILDKLVRQPALDQDDISPTPPPVPETADEWLDDAVNG